MFQCLGLGTAETGGCGEDWWHPGCIVGLGPDWYEHMSYKETPKKHAGLLTSITEVAEAVVDDKPKAETENKAPEELNAPPTEAPTHEPEDEDPPLPPGFPEEDAFEGFICYKCVDANPWIKRYAGAPGFLGPVFRRSTAPSPETGILEKTQNLIIESLPNLKKRRADDDIESVSSERSKRMKEDPPELAATPEIPISPSEPKTTCKVAALPPAPIGQLSLFFKSDFREQLCRCSDCFPSLKHHPQLLDEEEIYEPSVSSDDDEAGGSTVGSGSIYDRGESALKNVDRVRAIEGVMAYNHLKDKLTPFFRQFAESGQSISAEDIKAHFAKMRGDEQAIREAGEGAKKENVNSKKEQGGY